MPRTPRNIKIEPDPPTSSTVTESLQPDNVTSLPDSVLSTPTQPTNTADGALSPTPSFSSWDEPAWCFEADCIHETIYESEEAAQDAVTHFLQLLLDEDIDDTNVFHLRGRIVVFWTFEALPSDYTGSTSARY